MPPESNRVERGSENLVFSTGRIVGIRHYEYGYEFLTLESRTNDGSIVCKTILIADEIDKFYAMIDKLREVPSA